MSTISQSDRAARFQTLHTGPRAFVIPNAWDGGSAQVLSSLGFAALATSSGACAGVLGKRDGQVTQAEALDHIRGIVAVTDLPLSADLEKCFADAPEGVAETIRLTAQAGAVGGSVEDATGDPSHPRFAFDDAVARVAAAVAAARALPFPFTLTARTENFINGFPDLEDTIRRLKAFEMAGADVVFAPGLPDLAAVRAVCSAVSKPVNFMVGIKGKSFSVAELESAGVQRISLASSLYRAAMTGLLDAAREVCERGTFDYLDQALTTAELNRAAGR